MKEVSIFLLVALPAEAKPLIQHFGLKRQQPDGELPLYRANHITLVRSGVGRKAAAAATHFLFTQQDLSQPTVWLNVGIAGHATRSIGSPILASSVLDRTEGKQWELRIDFASPCETESLITLDQPEFDYSQPAAFDMEAAGFISTIKTIAPNASAHCFKIISDNRLNPAKNINGAMVSQLIRNQLDTIQNLLQLLAAAATQGSKL